MLRAALCVLGSGEAAPGRQREARRRRITPDDRRTVLHMPGTTTLPRVGARVRARRRAGGRWHKARVVAVRDDACDLDFPNYGMVEGVPPERIQGPEAPTRRRPPPASPLRKPRIRVITRGHKPAEPYRGDRKVDKKLKDSIGWCATRGDVDLLEEALKRRGLGARDAHGWSWLHHAAAGGATDHLKAILRVVRDHDDDDDEEEAPLEACEDLNGMTPLHLACVAKHVDCVRLLLKAGASATSKDSMGFAATELAGKAGHRARRIRALLDSKGETSDYSSSDSESDNDERQSYDPLATLLPDREYDPDPCPAPRHVPGACRCCDALDACEARWNQSTQVWIPPVRPTVGRLPPDGRTWKRSDVRRYYGGTRRNMLGTTRRG